MNSAKRVGWLLLALLPAFAVHGLEELPEPEVIWATLLVADMPEDLPLVKRSPVPEDVSAVPEIRGIGGLAQVETVWAPLSFGSRIIGEIQAWDGLKAGAEARAFEGVQSFVLLSGGRPGLGGVEVEMRSLQAEAGLAKVEVEMRSLQAEAAHQQAALRPFVPQRSVRWTDAPWSLTPFRVWTHGPAGRVRVQADGAWAEGDSARAESLRLEYWRIVNQATERRSLFGRLAEEAEARSRGGFEYD